MPNVVLYIKGDVYERLSKEKNKSGLVNRLLREHYKIEGVKNDK